MASDDIAERPVAAYFDSEAYNVLRQIDPGLMDSADYEARLRRRLAKRKWMRDNRALMFRGPGDSLSIPLGQQLTGPVPRSSVAKGGLEAPEGRGAVVPPNVRGGFAFGALLPMLPGLIGGLASAIPSIIGMFKRGKGAIAPPNLRRGGASAEVLRFLEPIAERIEQQVRGATSGSDFFHRLGEGIRAEVPGLLHKTANISPQSAEFITSRVLKRMGLPEGFLKFAAEEARRVAEKGAPYLEKRLGKRFGAGASERDIRGGMVKELVSPIIKYVASRALHGIKPARQFYGKAKQIMNSLDDVYKYTEPKGMGKSVRASQVERRGSEDIEEEDSDSVMDQPEHKRNLFSRLGKIARKVLGKTVSALAKPGSSALGSAVDAAAERVLGTSSTLGRSLAESLGESALSAVGQTIQEDDEEEREKEDDEGEDEEGARAPSRVRPRRKPPVAKKPVRKPRAKPSPPAPTPLTRVISTGAGGSKKKGSLTIRVL